MADTLTSPNMSLPIPVTNTDPGPDYANNINASLLLIDSHNHASGSGVQINPNGLNINIDLPINGNNLTSIRASRFSSQLTPIPATGSDLNEAYVSGVDLYYNDGNGNQVRITQSGGVAGSPGSIGSLTSPASATYVSATPAFVFQSDANTPANLDGGSLVLRDILANSKGVTLSAPALLAADYSITFPATLPGSQVIMQLNSAGTVSASNTVTNLTVGSGGAALTNSGTILVAAHGIYPSGTINAVLQGYTSNALSIRDNTNSNDRTIVVSPPGSSSGLVIVRGTVGIAATIISGEGWSVTRPLAGSYTVTFTTAFFDSITAVVTPDGDQITTQILCPSSPPFNYFNVNFKTGAVSTNTGFCFIAIAQRA